MGTVLHTRAEGFGSSRSPLQVGAELFGHDGIESDVEILSLVVECLSLMKIPDVHIDLGHVGIFRGLAQEANLSRQQEIDLFDALQRKAVTEIDEILASSSADEAQCRRLAALSTLYGGGDVLVAAREQLTGAGDGVMAALDNLCNIAGLLEQRTADVTLNFDLAELRGYNYQTGMVFAIFVPGCGEEIARGGRYDAIGEVFGRARPATGFSADLRILLDLGQRDFSTPDSTIFAPADNDPALAETVQTLRQSGERVICGLPGQAGDAGTMGCDRVLVIEKGEWVVKPV
jgi:ATP phosphoribosyltransferase regulatory subunit